MDLSTKYLGLTLQNPLVAAASPLSEDLDKIRQLEDAGASAVVMESLFEEQIDVDSFELDRHLSGGAESFAEALSYFPDLSSYNTGPDGYLEQIAKAKAAVKIPIIASLNGVSSGGWIRYAKKMEQAGADALELNIYTIPTDPALTSELVEQAYVTLVSDVASGLGIPVAVKLAPYFTNLANLSRRLDLAGAKGLVLFNRFYQPDFDLEALEVLPSLKLSTQYELLLRLHWVAILSGRVQTDFAITGGVHTAQDVLKSMMAGAQVVEIASAILKNGIGYLKTIENDLIAWMVEHEYESVSQLRGSASSAAVEDPSAYERANYMRTLRSWSASRDLTTA